MYIHIYRERQTDRQRQRERERWGGGIACWFRALDSRLKGCKFESWQENFLPQSHLCVRTVIWCPFHPQVTAVAHKRPRSFGQKCKCQATAKYAYTFDPTKSEWTDYATIQAECGNLPGSELTHNSSGNTRSQSSKLAEPMWTVVFAIYT